MSQLSQIIKSLENNVSVDAVLLVGSQSKNEHKEYSDIDLVVILKEKASDLQSLFQYVDGKPCDIFFFDGAMLQLFLGAKTIPANKMDAVLLGWLDTAHVYFDKSGVVKSLMGNKESLKAKLEVPVEEMVSFESKINAGYITNKRYFDSANPEYHDALETKLLQDVYNILIGYFEFRAIPWRGEKTMLRHLKEHDKAFYDLYMSYIRATTLKEKFKLYEQLVSLVFYGEYRLWDREAVRPYTNRPLKKEEQAHLVGYWNGLIKS
ncbi:MAG: nucleotidyltransferase domain-containing protein [Candidatus Paceibacterota bacterium]|jgi:hypothetical protein